MVFIQFSFWFQLFGSNVQLPSLGHLATGQAASLTGCAGRRSGGTSSQLGPNSRQWIREDHGTKRRDRRGCGHSAKGDYSHLRTMNHDPSQLQ